MPTAHAVTPALERDNGILGHPRGLFVCFATEMWERFSFYGMKFLLLLYLTKYHLFSDSNGLEVLGSYAALVYAMPVIGGLLADRYLGMRKAVVFRAAEHVQDFLPMSRRDVLKFEGCAEAWKRALASAGVALDGLGQLAQQMLPQQSRLALVALGQRIHILKRAAAGQQLQVRHIRC